MEKFGNVGCVKVANFGRVYMSRRTELTTTLDTVQNKVPQSDSVALELSERLGHDLFGSHGFRKPALRDPDRDRVDL